MPAVCSLLQRVARLEQGRASALPFVRAFGSLAVFEADTRAAMEGGSLDPRDMAGVLNAICRWHRDAGVWG